MAKESARTAAEDAALRRREAEVHDRHERIRAETDQLERQLESSGADVVELDGRLAEIEGREQELVAREAELKQRESDLDKTQSEELDSAETGLRGPRADLVARGPTRPSDLDESDCGWTDRGREQDLVAREAELSRQADLEKTQSKELSRAETAARGP